MTLRSLALIWMVTWAPVTCQIVHGPTNGFLMLEGGSNTLPRVVLERFLTLAGGPHAAIVLIPTAIPDGRSQQPMSEQIEIFKSALGTTRVTVLHTRDRAIADSEAFSAPLRSAGGVWIMGGQVQLLADVFVGTRTQRELQAVLDRGGVVGGDSAGAEIQGSMLLNPPNEVRRNPAGPVRGATSGTATNEEHGIYPVLQGFGLLQGVIVIPHVIQRHWESRMAEAETQHPGMLSIGIDVGSALVVHGDFVDVIGVSKVLIPAHSGENHGLVTLLSGDRFDLVKRVKVSQ